LLLVRQSQSGTPEAMPLPKLGWLFSGIQSAIFYYVSCGPCNLARSERQRRRQAKELELSQAQWFAENPKSTRYIQPPPFQTNKHWEEDIALGPFPMVQSGRRSRARTKDSGNGHSRAIASAGTATSDAGSSVNTAKRYQRPAEEFEDDTIPGDRRPAWLGKYTGAPQVNDLHPPVASVIPKAADERRWMKAPPPSTDFLRGTVAQSRRSMRPISAISAVELGPAGGESSYFLQPIDAIPTLPSKAQSKPIRIHYDSLSSDVDGSDGEDGPRLAKRPRLPYANDVAPLPKALRIRNANRPSLSTIRSHDSRKSQQSPSIRPQPDSENISPRSSPPQLNRPRSPASLSSASDHEISHTLSNRTHLTIPDFSKSRSNTVSSSSPSRKPNSRIRKDSIQPIIAGDKPSSVPGVDASAVDSGVILDQLSSAQSTAGDTSVAALAMAELYDDVGALSDGELDLEGLDALTNLEGLDANAVKDRIRQWARGIGIGSIDGMDDEAVKERLWQWAHAQEGKEQQSPTSSAERGRRWSNDF
jgi:hypothetical protein